MTAPLNPPLLLTSDLPSFVLGFGTGQTADLLKVIISASQQIERETRRYFVPRDQTRYFNGRQWGNGGRAVGTELYLDRDLQTLTTVTNGDLATVSSDDYTLAPRNSDTGKTIIRLTTDSGLVWTNGTSDSEGISLAGTWHYGGGWRDTGLAASAIASTTTTSITVSGASIIAGTILKIDSEYLYTEVGSATALTVSRGYLGSTAATHSASATVYRWECDSQVQALTTRVVTTMLERFKSPLYGQVQIGDLSIPISVDRLPDDIRLDLAQLRFVSRFGAA